MKFRDYLKNNIVYLDGGMGTLLQQNGLVPGECPERWNIKNPSLIRSIHKAYYDAGSNVVCTNTFGANLLKFNEDELDTIIRSAVENAVAARDSSTNKGEKYIALDIGPSGRMLRPYGDFDFEEAVSLFSKTVALGVKYGIDIIYIETMTDSYETKAAVLAAKENSDLPIIVSNAYSEDGKLMTGADPCAMVAMLEGMGVDVIGANCSLGPKQLKPVVEELLKYSSTPILFKPNAGLPCCEHGETHYSVNAEEFSADIAELIKKGVRLAGGCCGTTPDYIKCLAKTTADINAIKISEKNFSFVSSYSHSVIFDKEPILIGERLNPTGKKRLKQALLKNDLDYILNEGISQQEKNVHILDVNVGLPQINEVETLKNVVSELQAVIDLPLQIDTSNIEAMEAALRVYNGKAMINSVNGKEESMRKVFPLMKKYGGMAVALTLDENGIPATAEGRFGIAKKILKTAEEYGISKKDIIFDTLAMTVSTDSMAAVETLKAIKLISEKLICKTSLGVSNVSFGLPCRDAVNSTFFALALENGLSAAIMNPFSEEMIKTYYSYKALKGIDSNCSSYIEAASSFCTSVSKSESTAKLNFDEIKSALQKAIVKGLREQASELTESLLATMPGLEIITNEIVPALDTVGKGFEEKTVYLPQMLMSAEAAKAAFDRIKSSISENESKTLKGPIIIATVKGDIHDIGKNIVKLLLENYGYRVIDLGKDVSPETVLEAIKNNNARLCGLSALMTTTVPAMEETIKLIKEKAPYCKVVVGGAVLNKDYAERIGADRYSKDAMDTVRYANEVFN